jgi:hypothetical protein
VDLYDQFFGLNSFTRDYQGTFSNLTLDTSAHSSFCGPSSLYPPAMANYSVPLSDSLFSAIPAFPSDSTSLLAWFLIISSSFVWVHSKTRQKSANFPVINPRKGWMSLITQDNIKYYLDNGWEVQSRGAAEYNGQPYNVITTDGVVTVLPPRLAQEIRNEPNLSFLAVAATNLQSHLKGFDVYAVDTIQGELMLSVTRNKLPKFLGMNDHFPSC